MIVLRVALGVALCVSAAAWGQYQEFRLDERGEWEARPGPAPGTDEAVLAGAREHLALGRPLAARSLIEPWLERHARTDHPLLAEAYLIRGDSWLAQEEEYEALYDYELICREFPGTRAYATAVERELDIATRYVNGLKRKRFGIRFIDASAEGAELLVRVAERMPGSRLAERAMIELGDHYYRSGELELAGTTYELFLKNFPRSEYRQRAMQRQILSQVERYRSPRYDSTGLIEARALIEDYRAAYPADAHRKGLDQTLLGRIDEAMAWQMLESALAYERRGDGVSARFVLRRVVSRYPTTAAAEEAASRLARLNGSPRS